VNRWRAWRECVRRFTASIRGSRPDGDLEDELRLHLELAAEDEARRGLDAPDAARRARIRAGAVTQTMDTLRDQRGLPSLDALKSDLVFGWRQIVRHRTASLSAVLSLGLAMGASLTALRLVDAVLLRPLPVAEPSRLFVLTRTFVDADNRPAERDDFDYPTYRAYAALARDHADLLLIGAAVRRPIAIGADGPETAVQQFVSGNVFATLGLRPAIGRLLDERDDAVPDGHPVVVLSHDYWRRRFAADPGVLGRTLRINDRVYEIVGVTAAGFTGTEPGAVTDFFIPSMMNPDALDVRGWTWFRLWSRPNPGVDPAAVQALLAARFGDEHREGVKNFPADTPPSRINSYLSEQLVLRPAASGASDVQKAFRRPLWILTALAALLLLIACANVANLLLARAMSRRVEMALRLSIGAARRRLVQLMLMESLLLAGLAAAAGVLFAWWAAPFVVSMLAPIERPVRLILDLDWRTVVTAAAVTLTVTVLFGLTPALRASAASPHDVLKEQRGPRLPRRLADALIAMQMALSVFLLCGAGLFVATFEQLNTRVLGFTPDHLLHVVVQSNRQQTTDEWMALAASLHDTSAVDSAAVAGWAPLTGNRWRISVSVPGRPSPQDGPLWLSVSPGYFATMRQRLIEGREFRAGDRAPGRDERKQPVPGVAIVNEAFARVYFDGRSPIGRRLIVDGWNAPVEIVGLVSDSVYFDVRETIEPGVFVPLEQRNGATLLLRTNAGAGDLQQTLRRNLMRQHPNLVLHEVARFEALVTQQVIRERLLAVLSAFFAALALALAVIGVYGVLTYAVTRERREIGLRLALGARPLHLLGLIATRLAGMVGLGALAGVACGVAFGRLVRPLLFQIEPTDPVALGLPLAALAFATLLAVAPPLFRAMRVDPAETIRTET
jgi:predicted permease